MTVKLGPGIHYSTAPALNFAANAPIVKQRDDTSALQAAPAGAITVFRKVYSNVDQNSRIVNQNGSVVANEIIAALGGFKPTFVELFNECAQHVGDSPSLVDYVRWTSEAVPVLHAAGLRVAGFSFSTGNPEQSDWAYLVSQNYAGVDAVAIHEYWGPQGPSGSPWNALRHRFVDQWTQGGHPPFLITETGRDAVDGANCNGQTECGFRAQQVSNDQYVSELLAYDGLIAADAYVLGAAIFEAGSMHTDWWNFDIDDLVAAILGQSPPPPPPPPICPAGQVWDPVTNNCVPGSVPPANLLLLGGLAAIAAVYALIAAYKNQQEQNGESVEVYELDPGQPIPPGYREVV